MICMTLFHKRTVKWYKQMCVCTTNFSLGLSHVQSVENSIRKAASSNLYTVRNTNTCHSSAEQVHKIRTLTYTHTNAHSLTHVRTQKNTPNFVLDGDTVWGRCTCLFKAPPHALEPRNYTPTRAHAHAQLQMKTEQRWRLSTEAIVEWRRQSGIA